VRSFHQLWFSRTDLNKHFSRGSIKELYRKKVETIGGVPKEDDHEMIKEIRRRILTTILEAADCGFI